VNAPTPNEQNNQLSPESFLLIQSDETEKLRKELSMGSEHAFNIIKIYKDAFYAVQLKVEELSKEIEELKSSSIKKPDKDDVNTIDL